MCKFIKFFPEKMTQLAISTAIIKYDGKINIDNDFLNALRDSQLSLAYPVICSFLSLAFLEHIYYFFMDLLF